MHLSAVTGFSICKEMFYSDMEIYEAESVLTGSIEKRVYMLKIIKFIIIV